MRMAQGYGPWSAGEGDASARAVDVDRDARQRSTRGSGDHLRLVRRVEGCSVAWTQEEPRATVVLRPCTRRGCRRRRTRRTIPSASLSSTPGSPVPGSSNVTARPDASWLTDAMSVPDDPAGVAVPRRRGRPAWRGRRHGRGWRAASRAGRGRPCRATTRVVAVFERPKVDAPTVPASAASATAASPRTPASRTTRRSVETGSSVRVGVDEASEPPTPP